MCNDPCATGLLALLLIVYLNAPLRSSRTFACFLHISLQAAGFCGRAQGSALSHCYSAHMSPVALKPKLDLELC